MDCMNWHGMTVIDNFIGVWIFLDDFRLVLRIHIPDFEYVSLEFYPCYYGILFCYVI